MTHLRVGGEDTAVGKPFQEVLQTGEEGGEGGDV